MVALSLAHTNMRADAIRWSFIWCRLDLVRPTEKTRSPALLNLPDGKEVWIMCHTFNVQQVTTYHPEKHSRKCKCKTSVCTDHNSDDSAARSATSPALFLIFGATVSFERSFGIIVHLPRLQFLVFMNVVLHSLGVAAFENGSRDSSR